MHDAGKFSPGGMATRYTLFSMAYRRVQLIERQDAQSSHYVNTLSSSPPKMQFKAAAKWYSYL